MPNTDNTASLLFRHHHSAAYTGHLSLLAFAFIPVDNLQPHKSMPEAACRVAAVALQLRPALLVAAFRPMRCVFLQVWHSANPQRQAVWACWLQRCCCLTSAEDACVAACIVTCDLLHTRQLLCSPGILQITESSSLWVLVAALLLPDLT